MHTLRLDIQWLPLGDPDALVSSDSAELPVVDQVEAMELRVPLSWGNVEGVEPEAISHSREGSDEDSDSPDGDGYTESEAMRTITWERLPVKSGGTGEGSGGADGYRHVTVTVRFEKQIYIGQVITGRVVATTGVKDQPTAGLLSGIQGIVLHDSRGGDPRELKARMLVRVDVDFSLSLRNLRYQEQRVVPDAGRESDGGLTKAQVISGVIPDYETVIALTNALSADEMKYYVKGVVEHPPKTGNVRTHTNRSWDITGRYYDGVYPIDFHITLSGEEIGGEFNRRSGKAELKVSTSGVYTYKPSAGDEGSSAVPPNEDADMEKAIVDCQIHLHDKALGVLEEVKAASSYVDGDVEVTYARGGPVRAIGAAESSHQDDDVVDAELVEHEDGGHPGTRVPLQLGPPPTARERRRRISDSLLEGRISEQTYSRLIADLEADEAAEAGA